MLIFHVQKITKILKTNLLTREASHKTGLSQEKPDPNSSSKSVKILFNKLRGGKTHHGLQMSRWVLELLATIPHTTGSLPVRNMFKLLSDCIALIDKNPN